MKKLPIIFLTVVAISMLAMTACGPGAEEKARQDSIRVADSIRRADSIKLADSLKAEAAAAEQAQKMRQLVDETAASTRAAFVVKMYALNKVISANEGSMMSMKKVVITDVVTGKKTTLNLKQSDLYGCLVELKDLGDNKRIVAAVDRSIVSTPLT